jgi:hypothetical protein
MDVPTIEPQRTKMVVGNVALQIAAKALISKKVWDDVRKFAMDVEGQGMTSTEKHAAVRQDLINACGYICETMFNIAIWLAAQWVNNQLAKAAEV